MIHDEICDFSVQLDFRHGNGGQLQKNSFEIRVIINYDGVDIIWYSRLKRLQGVDQLDR